MTCSLTKEVSSAPKQSQMRHQPPGLELESSSWFMGAKDEDRERCVMDNRHERSSNRARVAECRRMKNSTPVDGSKARLRRERAQRCGKCSPVRDSPRPVPTHPPLCKVSSVRVCSVGARIVRGRVPQKLDQRVNRSEAASSSRDRWKCRMVVRTVWNGGDSR